MCLKNKIIAVIMCALITDIGIANFKTNTADAQSTTANTQISSTLSIEQLQQILANLQQQIRQVMQLIAQKNQTACVTENKLLTSANHDCCAGLVPTMANITAGSSGTATNYACLKPDNSVCGKSNLLPTDRANCTASGGNLVCANAACLNSTAASCLKSTCACNCGNTASTCEQSCKVKGYTGGYCNAWGVYLNSQSGTCKAAELNIGWTSDCTAAQITGGGRACCCINTIPVNICQRKLSGSPSDAEKNECSKANGTILCGNGWCSCSCSTTTCYATCKGKGYTGGYCNAWATGTLYPSTNNGCKGSELNLGWTSDCTATQLSGGGRACCCLNSTPFCGNGQCETGETFSSCPWDCKNPSTCGNGKCDANETASACPEDCKTTCGNGICEAGEANSTASQGTCPQDCGTPKTCYNEGEGLTGLVTSATPVLGCCPGLLSTSRTSCSGDSCVWTEGFVCKKPSAVCGNGICETGETATTCQQDCCNSQVNEQITQLQAQLAAVNTQLAQNTSATTKLQLQLQITILQSQLSALTTACGNTLSTCSQACQAKGYAGSYCNAWATGTQYPVNVASCKASTDAGVGWTSDCTAAEMTGGGRACCCQTPYICGDGKCQTGETATSCPADCGTKAVSADFVSASISTSSTTATSATPATITSTFNVRVTAKNGDIYLPKAGAFTVAVLKDNETDSTNYHIGTTYNQPNGVTLTGNSFKIPQNNTVTFMAKATYSAAAAGTYHLQMAIISWSTADGGTITNYIATPASVWSGQAVYLRGSNATPICGNGQCETGENTTSCPQDCKTSACLNAGYELGSGQSCCSGLLPLVQKHSIYTDNWTCLPLSASRTVCANCGDGICGPGESFCDCPQDCCTPGTTSGCKYCGTSEMWTDDSTKCASGQTCTGGTCIGHCANTCSPGSKQCSASINGYQNCFNTNYGCTEWSAPTACPAGQTCANGTCASPITNATLTINLDANSPKSRNIIADSIQQISGATLLAFDMQAKGGDLVVNTVNASFTVAAASTSARASVAPKTAYLYDDSGIAIGTAIPSDSGAVRFSNLNYPISKDTSKSFTIRIDASIPQASSSTHISNNDGQMYVVSVPNGGVSFGSNGTNSGSATSYAAYAYAEGPIFTLASINTSSVQPSTLSATFNVQVQAVSGDVYIPTTGAFAVDYGRNGMDSGIASNTIYTQPYGTNASGNYYKIAKNTSATFAVNATYVLNSATGATFDLRMQNIAWNHTGSVGPNVVSNYMTNDPMWISQAIYLQGAIQPVCGNGICEAGEASVAANGDLASYQGTCPRDCGQVVGGNCTYKTFPGKCTITSLGVDNSGFVTANYSFVPSGTVDISGTYLKSATDINPYTGTTSTSGLTAGMVVSCSLNVITGGTCTPITATFSTASIVSGATSQLPFSISSISASLSQIISELAALLAR